MKIRRPLVFRLLLGFLASTALASCTTTVKPAASIATATARVAPTAVPTRLPVSVPIGVIVEHRADGISMVRDVSNAYQFALGPEWTVIPVSQEDIDRVAQASPALDAEFLRLAQKLSDSQTEAFRLIGINTDSKYAGAENPTLLLVTAIPDRVSASLPMPKLAEMVQETVFTNAAGDVVQQEVAQNSNGLQLAVVEGPYDYDSTQGETLKMRCTALAFQANSRVILIQFITPVESGPDVLSGAREVMDTIQNMRP